jgi:bifunctional non-homologous end joining protein LigD
MPPRPQKSNLLIPSRADNAEVRAGRKVVKLTNLGKPFWPALGITKGDLLAYYAAVSSALLPHLKSRAMVMKRYPHGAAGPFFFMKRTPSPRPEWLQTCEIEHDSGNVIAFPVIQDIAALLWVVNLGCIDLNQWYSRCDDVDRPDYLHFDLDPGPGAPFSQVLEAALLVRDALGVLGLPCYPKTSGSKGMHVYVPLRRGPRQKDVWTFTKAFAITLAERHPQILTAQYRVAKRPRGRVLVDYNQNAWGRTLASVYSVRPTPTATVSTPLTWNEVERGIETEHFTMDVVLRRIAKQGDLFAPVLEGKLKLPYAE